LIWRYSGQLKLLRLTTPLTNISRAPNLFHALLCPNQ
jgi:hypothetical protein